MFDERIERHVQGLALAGALACFSLAGWLYLSPDVASEDSGGAASGSVQGTKPGTGNGGAGGARVLDPGNRNDELLALRRWTGDLDGMIERRVIRALVVHDPMQYFLDGGTQRGTAYELLMQLEEAVNERFGNGAARIHVAFLPVGSDQLLPLLEQGYGDIAAANLTLPPEPRERLAYSAPFLSDVREVVVSARGLEPIEDVAGLAGREIHVRHSSSHQESLLRQNRSLAEQGMETIEIVEADALLDDADLLEMVSAGIIPMVVVEEHKALFWAGVFDNLQVHPAAIANGGSIAWALRKDSPELEQFIDEFAAEHKQGTLLGNITFKRYLKGNEWVRNPLTGEARARFLRTVDIFRKYGDQYGFDWLMLAALGYQESKLDQGKRSAAGAIGVMQVLPGTAADPNVDIRDIEDIDNNIHAGTRHLRFLRERYFSDENIAPRDRTLFAFASYNAGPARIARLRRNAAERGLDPDTWFDNVEIIAAEQLGREAVQYVSNIYKYCVAYRLLMDSDRGRRSVKTGPAAG